MKTDKWHKLNRDESVQEIIPRDSPDHPLHPDNMARWHEQELVRLRMPGCSPTAPGRAPWIWDGHKKRLSPADAR